MAYSISLVGPGELVVPVLLLHDGQTHLVVSPAESLRVPVNVDFLGLLSVGVLNPASARAVDVELVRKFLELA